MPQNRQKTGGARAQTVGRKHRPQNSAKQRRSRSQRSDARRPQNRENRGEAVGRFTHGENTGENTEDLICESPERSDLLNGISREQRHFILEKLVGQNDKDDALAAGYAPSMAANTKQKIWARPGVRAEFERLKGLIFQASTRPHASSSRRRPGLRRPMNPLLPKKPQTRNPLAAENKSR